MGRHSQGNALLVKAADVVEEARERVHAEYGRAIGREISGLVTPALVLHLPAAIRNISFMSDHMRALPSDIRPHIKVHRSPDLARLQLENGAKGLSTATVWEAVTMAAAGFDDIFVVNTVTGVAQLRTLAELAGQRRILVAVDDAGNAEKLSLAAKAASSTLGVVLEVDTGMNRAGVDSEEKAIALARELADVTGLRFEGLTGYEGHCTLTPDRAERHRKHQSAMRFLVGVAERLAKEGIPVGVRSAGGTATWKWTAEFPGITEIQAGSYVLMDNFHGQMVHEFEKGLTVAANVISRRSDRVILNAGSKALGASALATVKDFELACLRLDEEHGIFASGSGGPHLGEVVEVVPGYAPSAVDLFDAYHVVEDGVVIDIWPVVPRGPGHHGLADEH